VIKQFSGGLINTPADMQQCVGFWRKYK